MIGGCVFNSIINDHFLHTVASAPKLNKELKEVVEYVLGKFIEAEKRKAFKECNVCLKEHIDKVVQVLRGLMALLSPKVHLWDVLCPLCLQRRRCC